MATPVTFDPKELESKVKAMYRSVAESPHGEFHYLATDKSKVFSEVARLLKSGGRFAISDIVTEASES